MEVIWVLAAWKVKLQLLNLINTFFLMRLLSFALLFQNAHRHEMIWGQTIAAKTISVHSTSLKGRCELNSLNSTIKLFSLCHKTKKKHSASHDSEAQIEKKLLTMKLC